MDELADLDEITYVRFAMLPEFQGCRWVRNPLETNYEGNLKKKKENRWGVQYAFRIFKNNLLPPVGCIEQHTCLF